MSELTITILRVACTRPTDTLVEGSTDETGWRLIARNEAGKTMTKEAIPDGKLVGLRKGSDVKLNRELPPLGPQWRTATLEFWEKDSFSSDDLLGRIEIQRNEGGEPDLSAGDAATDLGDGRFRLTGGGGDYKVSLRLVEG